MFVCLLFLLCKEIATPTWVCECNQAEAPEHRAGKRQDANLKLAGDTCGKKKK
jgi:hypothetical protein